MSQAEISFRKGGEAVCGVVEEFDRQNRLTRLEIQFEQITRRLELELALGLIQQHAVQVLDGNGFQVQQFHRRLHCLGHRGEEYQAKSRFLGQGNDSHDRRDDGGQRSFASAE